LQVPKRRNLEKERQTGIYEVEEEIADDHVRTSAHVEKVGSFALARHLNLVGGIRNLHFDTVTCEFSLNTFWSVLSFSVLQEDISYCEISNYGLADRQAPNN
jgi:hypothetical protein